MEDALDEVRPGSGGTGDAAGGAGAGGGGMGDAVRRVLARVGGVETVERLAGLSGSDFTSVMLEVARRRAARETPASVLRRYEQDRFVRPGQVSARVVRRAEDVLLGSLPDDVEVVLLAPLVPLGTHSALGPVSQDKVITTVRSCEVAADPTNALALEAASRRVRSRDATVRLAGVQRVVRAQPFAAGFFAHFGLFALVTAGRDAGSLRFERAALAGHLRVLIRGVGAAGAARVQVALTPLSDAGERIAAAVTADLGRGPGADPGAGAGRGPGAGAGGGSGAEVVIDRGRQAGRGYYRDLCFKVNVYVRGETQEVGDGGFTDWTARLTANRKERLLISGVGIDRLAAFGAPARPMSDNGTMVGVKEPNRASLTPLAVPMSLGAGHGETGRNRGRSGSDVHSLS